MSIENDIQRIADALEALLTLMPKVSGLAPVTTEVFKEPKATKVLKEPKAAKPRAKKGKAKVSPIKPKAASKPETGGDDLPTDFNGVQEFAHNIVRQLGPDASKVHDALVTHGAERLPDLDESKYEQFCLDLQALVPAGETT